MKKVKLADGVEYVKKDGEVIHRSWDEPRLQNIHRPKGKVYHVVNGVVHLTLQTAQEALQGSK